MKIATTKITKTTSFNSIEIFIDALINHQGNEEIQSIRIDNLLFFTKGTQDHLLQSNLTKIPLLGSIRNGYYVHNKKKYSIYNYFKSIHLDLPKNFIFYSELNADYSKHFLYLAIIGIFNFEKIEFNHFFYWEDQFIYDYYQFYQNFY